MTRPASCQEDLTVLKGWKQYDNARNALYDLIAGEAYRFLVAREKVLAGINTREQYRNYTESVHRKLGAAFGPMPVKIPLNARVTGTLEHEGIAVEKIIFESRPGFWVTGCIFRPLNRSGRLPAILYVCGHTADGFRGEAYQQVILNLALKGFLVFTIDPVGQGERIQYFDESKNTSLIGGPTKEHSYAGLQYLLLGRTMAMVRLWDGIRAIDYLTERPDVDPKRIGVHGRSGGGTMSAYLGAMDTRITASAPECYITSYRRLLQSIGPQDAEQNLLSQISSGLDHGDFLVARDLKPTCVVTTSRDFFSIQGARETVRSLQAITPLRSTSWLSMVEDDAPHQSTKKNREAVYRFFMDALKVQGNSADENVASINPELLRVTPTGQTVTSGSKDIYDIIRHDAADLLKTLDKNRKKRSEYSGRIINAARELSGFRYPVKMDAPVFCGSFVRDGYRIEKYILDGEGDLPLPVLLFVPDGGNRCPALLVLDPGGKQSNAEPGGLIEVLARKGYCILSPDLPGTGELTVNTDQGDSVFGGVSYNLIFGAQLIGKSITGIQASHIVRAYNFLNSLDYVIPGSITGISTGVTGPVLMHAAVLDSEITAMALIESPLSWESVINKRLYDHSIGSTIVPSALTSYDLPDLLCVFAPKRMLVWKPLDGDAQPLPEDMITRYRSTLDAFYAGKKGQYTIVGKDDSRSLADVITGWLEE